MDLNWSWETQSAEKLFFGWQIVLPNDFDLSRGVNELFEAGKRIKESIKHKVWRVNRKHSNILVVSELEVLFCSEIDQCKLYSYCCKCWSVSYFTVRNAFRRNTQRWSYALNQILSDKDSLYVSNIRLIFISRKTAINVWQVVCINLRQIIYCDYYHRPPNFWSHGNRDLFELF